MSMSMFRRNRFAAGAALMAVSLLFVSCPREVGLGGAVDTQKPVVSISSPDVDAVVKDVITLTGKATDETALEGVSVTFQSSESSFSKTYPATTDIKAGTWTLTVDSKDVTNGLPDSKYEAIVTAKDKSGKTSTAARSFQLDNCGPTILVTKPSTYGNGESIVYYKQVEIKGESYDASSINSVTVSLYKEDGTCIAQKTADGTDTWSAVFYLADLSGANLAQNEKVYIYISATDRANNTSSSFYHKQDLYELLVPYKQANPDDELYFPTTTQIGYLDVNPDTSSRLVVNGVNKNNEAISNPPDIKKTDLTDLRHEIIPETGISASKLDAYPYFYFTSTGSASIEWNSWDDADKSISTTSPILASIQPPSDGSSVLLNSLKVQFVKSNSVIKTLGVQYGEGIDGLFSAQRMGEAVNLSIPTQDNGINPATYDIYLSGITNSNTVIGYEFDNASGLYLDNGSKITEVTILADTISITDTFYPEQINEKGIIYPAPAGLTATDKANVGVWYIKKGSNPSGDFKLPVNISGLGDTTQIKIKIGSEPEDTVTRANADSEFNGEYTVDYNKLNTDGPTSILLKAGNASRQVYVQRDEDGPDLKPAVPVSGKIYNAESKDTNNNLLMTGDSLQISGSALDSCSGLYEVKWSLDGGTNWSADCKTGNSTWSASVDLSSEGKKTLTIRAVDNLNNETVQTIDFFYDKAGPGITETGVTDSVLWTHENFTLKGKAWDSGGIDEITVSTTVGGSTKVWSSKEGGGTTGKTLVADMLKPDNVINSKVASEASIGSPNWSIEFEVGSTKTSSDRYVDDGTKLFTIKIKDIAGNETTLNRTVTLDTVNPVITKDTDDGFADPLVKHDERPFVELRIHATDSGLGASGLEGVYYQLSDNKPTNLVTGWEPMVQGTSNRWTASIDFSSIDTDTTRTAWFMAKDRSGNAIMCNDNDTTVIDLKKPVLSVKAGAPAFTDAASDVTFRIQVADTNSIDETNPRKPAVTINKPTGGAVNSDAFTVTYKADDSVAKLKEYEVSIKFLSKKDCFMEGTNFIDGDYTIDFAYSDENGRTADGISHTIKLDTKDPVVTLTDYTVATSIKENSIIMHGTVTEANLKTVLAWLNTENPVDITSSVNTSTGAFEWKQYDLAEGDYVVHIEAEDVAGRKGSKDSATITVDRTLPDSTLEQNEVGYLSSSEGELLTGTSLADNATYLTKDGFTLKGVINEEHLKSVKLSVTKDVSTVIENARDLTPAAGSTIWTYTQGTEKGDGTYVYTLELEDLAGNKTTKTLTVKIDTTAPVILITTPADGVSTSVDVLTIRGTADDAVAGVKEVFYSLDGTDPDPESVDALKVDLNSNTWSKTLNLTDEKTYTLKVIAVDKLSTASAVSEVAFSYDKADPELKELIVGNDSTTVNTGFTLGGKAWDSNEIDEITVSTSVGGVTKTWSSKTANEITLKPDNVVNSKVATEADVTDNNWSIAFVVGSGNADKGNFIADGTNSFTIVIKDIAGKSRSYNRTIKVDSTVPEITGGSFATTLVKKDESAFVGLTVQASDPVQTKTGGSAITGAEATGLAGVYYKITDSKPSFATDADESTWTAMSQGASSWSANVDFSAITTDGTQKAWIAAKDRAGNRVILDSAITTYVDLTKPVLEIVKKDAATDIPTFTSRDEDLYLYVKETDTNLTGAQGVIKPTVKVNKPDGTLEMDITGSYITDETPAGVTAYKLFKVQIPFKSATGVNVFKDDGNYTVIIDGKDIQNREAKQITHEILQDTTAPVVTLNQYTSDAAISTNTIAATATVTDANLVKVEAWLTDDKGTVLNGDSNTIDTRETLFDKAAGIDKLKNGSYPYTQYSLDDGKYIVKYRATDAANKSGEATSGVITVDTVVPISSINQQTANTLYDVNGNKIADTTLLAVAAPGNTQKTDAGTFLATSGYTLTGQISENNLKSAKLTVKKDGNPLEEDLDLTTAVTGKVGWTASLKTWTFTQAIAAVNGDGTYSYTLVLEDNAGNKTTETITVKVDTTRPTLIITTPGAGQATSLTSMTIRGTADDEGAGIKDVKYSYLDNSLSTSATRNGNSWYDTLSFTDEGTFTLSAKAIDNLGWESDVQTVQFSYDKADPELKELVIGNNSTIKNEGFALGGKAWDSNKIDEITVSTSVDGVTKTWSSKEAGGKDNKILVNTMLKPDSEVNSKVATEAEVIDNNWSIDFVVGSGNAGKPNFIADGTNSFTIVITDIAGKSRSYNRTVTVDSTMPAISVETGDGFQKSLVEKDISAFVELKVHATDPLQTKTDHSAIADVEATGLAGVYYQITDSSVTTAPDYTTETGWTAMSQGTGIWSASIDFSDIATDCEKKVWIFAKDRAGNRTLYGSSNTNGKLKTLIDQHKPVLSFDASCETFTSGSQGTNPHDLTLKVRVTDTNPDMSKLRLAVLKPNGSTVGISDYTFTGPVDPAAAGYKEYQVIVPFSSQYNKFDVDGEYTIILNGKDVAGRDAASVSHKVLKDSQTPEINLESYQEAASINVGTLSVTGTVTDSNLQSVTIWLNDDEASAQDITNTRDRDGKFIWTKYELPEGDYIVHVKAVDTAGLTAEENTATVTIDKTVPRTSIEQNDANSLYTTDGTAKAETMLLAANVTGTDAGTYLAKSAFTLKGGITETKLASATLHINGDATGIDLTKTVNGSHTWNGTSKTWTYTQPVNANDGTYEYVVKLVDEAGNQTTETVTVKIDTTKPTVSITKPGADESFLTAPVTVNGTASDAIAGISKVYYTTDGTAPDATSPSASVNGSSWSASVLTGDTVAEGKFKLKVVAEDKLGLVSDVSEVDFSFDKADPELKELIVGNDSKTFNEAFTLGGKAWDSNQIDEITISAVVGGVTKTWSSKATSEITLKPNTEVNSKVATETEITANNWSMYFAVGIGNKNANNYLTDGTISFTITIKDIAGKSRSYNRTVTVDSKAPTIKLTENDGFVNSTVEQDVSPYNMLKATVADEIETGGTSASGIEGVWYKIASTQPADNDATWADIVAGSNGWTAMSQGTSQWMSNVDFSDTSVYNADGEQYAWIAAKDRAGNRAILPTGAETYIDQYKPVLSVVNGDDFTDAVNDLVLTVRVKDSNPKDLSVTVLKPKADGTAGTEALSTANAGVTVAPGTTVTGSDGYQDYQVTIPFKKTGTKASYYSTDGIWTLQINAKDDRGRVADQKIWTVLKDQTAPVVELTSPTTKTYTSNRTLTVTGRVKDDNISSVEAWLNDNEADAENITNLLGLKDADGWQTFEWKQYDLSEGTYVVHIRATDKANLVNPVEDGTSANITIDFTAPVATYTYEKATGATDDVDLYTNEGTPLLEKAPVKGGTYYAKAGFILKGTITEPNFKEAELTIKKDNEALDPVTIKAAGVWKYEQGATDGTYEYTLSVKDKANNSIEEKMTVVVDTTAPEVTVITPGNNESFVITKPQFRGTASDEGAGLKEVYYTTDGTDPVAGTSSTMTRIGGSWNKGMDFSGVSEGVYALKVMAEDKIGNVSAIQTVSYSYDLHDPELTETGVGDGGKTTKENFTLSGTAWDSNAIDEITISNGTKTWSNKSGDGKTQVDSIITADGIAAGKATTADGKSNVTTDNWGITFKVGSGNSSKATYIADGTTTFTITIKDVAGKSRAYTRTVTVDTAAPTITKETGDGFQNALVAQDESPFNKLTIHASDSGTGLEGVWYKISATEPSFTSDADEAVWTAMAQGTAGWTANVDFSDTSVYSADGTQKAWIAAKDRVGNRAVYAAGSDSDITTWIDIKKPVLSVEPFTAGEPVVSFTDGTAEAQFRVRVTDTNPVTPTIVAKDKDGNVITDDGISKIEDITITGTSDYKEWKITVPFNNNGGYSADGMYTFIIDGKDGKDRVADQITHDILRDSSAPTVTLTSYQDITFTAVGTLTVQGSVSDNNLVKVEAWLEKDGVAQPAEDITNTLDNTGAFTWKQYDLDEAVYIVHVKATDKAQLTGEATTQSITVDKTAASTEFKKGPIPGQMGGTITWTAGATYNEKDGYTLTGTITELHLDSANMTVKKDGTKIHDWTFADNWTAYDNDPDSYEYGYDSSIQMFEIPVELDKTDHTDDGTYVYSLTVIDKAGNREEKSVTVLVDTTAPTLIITKPAAKEQLETGSYKFAGNVSDMGVGVKSVTYKLTNGGTEISSGNAAVTGASWTINGTENVGIDLQSEGTLVIEVTATDKLDQQTVATTPFYYDQGAPILTETGVGVGGLTTNAAFTLSGTASDTNALKGVNANGVAVGAISIYTGSGASKVDYGTVNVKADGTWSMEMTPGTETGELADGTYTFYITAADVSARETTVQRTVVVDTQAPAINKISGKSAFITDAQTNTWYNKGTLALGAAVTDNEGGSGVASVEYAVLANPASVPTADVWDGTSTTWAGDTPVWKSMTRGASGFTANAEVTDGKDYIVIRATDAAGNITYTTQEIAEVDTLEPGLAGVYSDSGYTEPLFTMVTNADSTLYIYIKTEDPHAVISNTEGSRVTDVVATIGDKTFAPANCIATSGNDNEFVLVLDPEKLLAAKGTTDTQKTVYVKIIDIAGNTSSATSLITLQYDTVGPDIEFISPVEATADPLTTVNKKVTITGKANDLQGLKNVTLYYLYNSTDENERESVGDVKTGKDATNWTYTFDTSSLLSAPLNGAESKLTFIAYAEDEAGNVNKESIMVKLDQEEDIPTVTINTFDLNGMSSTTPVWLKGNNRFFGTVTDDDGVRQLDMSTDGGSTWTKVPVTGGSFQVALPADDTYTVLFRVTDTEGGIFTSGDAGLTALKLRDGNDETYASPDGKLYITVDTEIPQIQTTKFALDGTSTNESDWSSSLVGDTVFGGTDKTQFTLKQYAYDENGIKKVEVIIDGGTPVEAAIQASDTYTDALGDTYTAYTYTVDATSISTSTSHTLKVVVTDNADMTNETTVTFKVDNTAPTVDLTSHESGARVKGTLFISGTTQDAPLYGPATSMVYKVSDSETVPADWTTADTTSSTHSAHAVKGNLASWRIYFDDDVNNITDSYTHDRALKKVLTMLDSYKNTVEIATEGDHIGAVVYKSGVSGHTAGSLYQELTTLYLHIKATDAYGNEEFFVQSFVLDPQGDIPSVAVSYPTILAYGWKNGSDVIYTKKAQPVVGDAVYTSVPDMETGVGTVSAFNRSARTITYNGTVYTNYGGEAVQGGIVRLQGTAEDEKAIKGIYMQIDPTYDRASGFQWDASGNALMPDGDKKLKDYYTIADIGTSGMKGILAGSSVAWSTTLNKEGEFNGLNKTTNLVGVRLYAVDTDNNVSPLNITDDIIISIDADSPLVGNSEELWLKQYSNSDGTGSVTAQMKYEDDMSLKGEWWLEGSVEDPNGIIELTVKKQNADGSLTDITNSVVKTNNTWTEGDTTYGYSIKFKVGSSAANAFGTLAYQIYAVDGDNKTVTKIISVKYDNKAPVLTTPDNPEEYRISHEVVQSNGFYTLGSSLTEVGTDIESQSGFERLALYFVRPGNTTGSGTLYDTYYLKSSGNNQIDLSTMKFSDGLYWKTKQVMRNPGNLSTMTLTENDDNIHKGGLVKIGGTVYVITSVDGMNITVNGSPAIANTNMKEDVDFAMAVVVDHALTEGNGTTGKLDNGYFKEVINDDGDGIVEKVTTQGYTTFWEVNINSRNIPDGAIEIHYVAFDKAGNYATGVVACDAPAAYKGKEGKTSNVPNVDVYDYDAANLTRVANNAPRLAGVLYGTDDNGNGTVEDSEMHSELFAMTLKQDGTKESYTTSSLASSYTLGVKTGTAYSGSVLNIKGATKIVPEIVGGNGALGYSMTATKNNSLSPYFTKPYAAISAGSGAPVTGSDYSATGDGSEIKDVAINLSMKDLLTKQNGVGLDDGQNQLLSFTIWDSTEGLTAGSNSQKATLEMVATLNLNDTVQPKTYIKPFYWKSTTDNSVYRKTENGKSYLLGHIELGSEIGTLNTSASGINDTDDKVSGAIVIEGTAQDNVLLKEIYLKLYDGAASSGTDRFTFTGAGNQITSGNANKFYSVASYSDGTWTSKSPLSSYATNGWAFVIDEANQTFTQEEGHTVQWQLILNTEKLTKAALSNVHIAVLASDKGRPTLSDNTITYAGNINTLESSPVKTSTATQTNYNQFDVVPYITGVSTSMSVLKKNNPTVYNRSSLGRYSVAADETVTLAGFNLSGAKYGNTTLTTLTSGEQEKLLAYYKTTASSFVKLPVNLITTSGGIQITNNSIPSLNNVNNNNAKGAAVDENGDPVVLSTANYDVYAYNRQPNGDNNQNLTDDVIFDIWTINNNAARTRDGGSLDEPVMKINPKGGAIGFAFASGADTFCMPGGSGNNQSGAATNNSYYQWSKNYANFSNIALDYDSDGNAFAIAVGLDTNSEDTYSGYSGRMALMTSLWGRGNYDSDWDNFNISNKLRIDCIGIPKNAYAQGAQKDNYQIDAKRFSSATMKVIKHGNDRAVYLAYYDRLTGQIRFRSGQTNRTERTTFGQFSDNTGYNYNGSLGTGYVGDGTDPNQNYGQDWNQHRTFELEETNYSLIAGNESRPTNARNGISGIGNDTGFTAGKYVALDVVDNDSIAGDTVVVVFYDGSDLWYVTRTGGVGTDNNVLKTAANGNWSKPVMVFEGIGQNAAIKVAPDKSIHIACYDQSEGALKYAYMSSATGTSFKTATIDGYGIAGSNISIDVVKEGNAYIPYLSYYVPSIQKVKMAYLADYSALSSSTAGALDGCDESDSYSGVWECAIIPSDSSVNDDNTNIGFYKNEDGVAQAIKSNMTASAGTGSGNCNGNGTANPVVAYGITRNASGYIEVVQKK